MRAQEHSPDSSFPSTTFDLDPQEWQDPRPLDNAFLRYAGVFVVGLLVGWFALGWYLFPLAPSEVYPSELRADIQDDYILMTAEAYAATHDLRTAAKRLRYWEPETVAQRVNQMALALEKVEPERSAYLWLLAKDLHLDLTQPPAAPSPSKKRLPFTSVSGLLAFLGLSGLILYFAWRKGLFTRPQQAAPEAGPAHPPADVNDQDQPVQIMPMEPPGPAPAVAPLRDEGGVERGAPPPGDYEFATLPERESVWAPRARGMAEAEQAEEKAPWEPDFEEDALDVAPEAYEAPIAAPPEDFTTVPSPPPALGEEETPEEEDATTVFGAPQVLRFDGSPDYNAIAPIEMDDDFGQFVLGVALTAPHNPNQVIALEALLYDRNDIRTVSALLAPLVLVNDPELMNALSDQPSDSQRQAFPLQPGAVFRLETAYLAVEGKVRKVQFGPRTRDGVPVIEFAEIEFTPRRAGEGV
ncbi:MAG TPA: hypothetical protein EYP25_06645 [Anaerolineae bacterium]|nr:hypothetical protein [Anaerolineae bacterium]